MPAFRCSRCGELHDELPLAYGAEAPEPYFAVAPEERERRCDLSSDLCVIDGEHFFIHGCLEIPLLDGPGPFVWGVWCSLSRESFERALAAWERPDRDREPPYFGWLCTRLPGYPETLYLKTHVHARPPGERPWIELEPTDHPLAVEQRTGIRMARVQQIAETVTHAGTASEVTTRTRDRRVDERT